MKILVTLDGSHFSESILGTVLKLAPGLDAEVELLMVERPDSVHATRSATPYQEMTPMATSTGARLSIPFPSEQVGPTAETREQALQRREDEVRRYLASRAKMLDGVRTTITVDFADDPAELIIQRARAENADLIAMATHGRSGINHFLAGSVCEQVIRSGVAPVIVLRP